MANTTTKGMTDLFSEAGVTVMELPEKEDDGKITCHWVNYKDTTKVYPLELFQGYNSLKAITFSFEFSFVSKLVDMFDTAEIVLGAEFIAAKMNTSLAEQMATVMANADEIKISLHRNKRFAKRVVEGDVEIRYPNIMADHRKIYMLKADDGRVRTIMPSANMSGSAWDPEHHIENYVVCDDMECYEAYLRQFDTVWSLSDSVIPDARVTEYVQKHDAEVLEAEESRNLEEALYDVANDNPVILKAKKNVDTAIVVQQSNDSAIKMEIIRYNKDILNFEEQHKEYLKEIKLRPKEGVIPVLAKTVKKYLVNAEKYRQKKLTIEKRSEEYPRMYIDYANGTVYIGNKMLDLSPSDGEIRKDISELLSIFDNYNRFVGDRKQAKHNHFKLLNAMFSSVFNAKLRCAAKMKNIGGVSALPLYMLLNSPPDCGKTFMVRVILKMMTGIENFGYKYRDVKSKELSFYQTTHKGIPIFIDEISSSFSLSFAEMIKTPQECEENVREDQPLTIFVSNKISSPKKELRKRMIFLTYKIKLPSRYKRREFETLGTHILHRMGTALYRKYLSRMLPYVMSELEKIETGEGLDDNYSPELMQKSSEIILSLIQENGFVVPDYMKILTWDDDYADNSRATYEDALNEIKGFYKSNRKIFTVDEKFVTICMSKDIGEKYCSSWETALPNEIMVTRIPDAEYAKIRMDRKELENHLGIRFDTGLKARLLNFLS